WSIALEKRFFAGIGIADNLPGIARHFAAMNQNGGDSAFTRSFEILVNPAAIKGERAAFEKAGIVGSRLVDEHQEDLAADINAFVVVPLIFGSFNTVANVNDLGIDIVGGFLRLIVGDVLLERFEF